MISVSVNDERCTGHGRCYDLAPSIFAPDEYGHAVVTMPNAISEADMARAYEARDACPEGAVRLRITTGGAPAS